LLEGCDNCGGKFFFFMKEDSQIQQINLIRESLSNDDIKEMEDDVRKLLSNKEPGRTVILDVETIKTFGPGKFTIDVSALMRGAPVIINVSPGKYYIDLPSAFKEKSSKRLPINFLK